MMETIVIYIALENEATVPQLSSNVDSLRKYRNINLYCFPKRTIMLSLKNLLTLIAVHDVIISTTLRELIGV